MPDILDETGLTTSTFTEVRDTLVDDFRAIYGSDINVNQNSPDGQMINIFAQAGIDYRELATTIYNSFNPDTCIGTILDQRCAINNIQRLAGTFTILSITIVVDRTVTLQGLDADYNNVNGTGYTIQDNAGNQFVLIDTVTLTKVNVVSVLGAITPGSGYTSGTYYNVYMTIVSGTPNTAGYPVICDIIISGGVVISVTLVDGGRGCDTTTVLSALAADIGGTGGGFSIPVTTVLSGTYLKEFRAKSIGLVETVLDTVTVPVTIVLGVVSVNNDSAPTTIGQNEETDAQLRVRRIRSVSIAAQGYLNSLQGTILDLDGVTQAKVYENVENITVDTIPANSIWVIVEGGANTDIGNAIYAKKSGGCGMKGSVEVDITTPADQIFTSKFDRPTAEDLYVRFDLKPTVIGFIFDQTAIKQNIVDNLSYQIGDPAYTTNITALAQTAVDDNGGGGIVLNVEISDDGTTWVDYLDTTGLNYQFTIDIARITITEI